MKYKCPCCEFFTLEDNPIQPTFEICPVCFWENDPLQSEKPDYSGGANRISLNEAKLNYKNLSVCKEDMGEFVRMPYPEEIQS